MLRRLARFCFHSSNILLLRAGISSTAREGGSFFEFGHSGRYVAEKEIGHKKTHLSNFTPSIPSVTHFSIPLFGAARRVPSHLFSIFLPDFHTTEENHSNEFNFYFCISHMPFYPRCSLWSFCLHRHPGTESQGPACAPQVTRACPPRCSMWPSPPPPSSSSPPPSPPPPHTH